MILIYCIIQQSPANLEQTHMRQIHWTQRLNSKHRIEFRQGCHQIKNYHELHFKNPHTFSNRADMGN